MISLTSLTVNNFLSDCPGILSSFSFCASPSESGRLSILESPDDFTSLDKVTFRDSIHRLTFVAILVLTGIFWAMVNVNSLPLVYDHGDEKRIGAYTGLYYFSSQLAAVLGPTMGGIMVDTLGDQYRWLFIYGAIFMGLALLVMTRVKK